MRSVNRRFAFYLGPSLTLGNSCGMLDCRGMKDWKTTLGGLLMAIGGVFMAPFDGVPVWVGPVLMAVGGSIIGVNAKDKTKGDKS